ncbi:hypothetical protein [Paremcibacter congregatus]|uniref:Uncharacterized protein n=1 Tax=Paremcibacter congregatus TaxID=2043170 RepID=A0A2G4YRR9_9PROT|nr:hypothetical protein [Paremcibacter congregatus]PHZ85029.1 hypothetical protein CRD36_09940 [Paremcibacter congregatus]QDE25996.1 hypothetical protein FIV45_01210 [Paremcibacter congregatus]|tara:strand:+ start:1307 stop:2290 length:984 start_codon:yes stop_codon:yes gene_type:complete
MGSIALPAVIFMLSLLPGYILINAYNRAEGAPLNYAPFAVTTTKAIIYAAFFHLVWFAICHALHGVGFIHRVDINSLAALMMGRYDHIDLQNTMQPLPIFLYFMSQYLVALLLGHVTQYFVLKHNLDWAEGEKPTASQKILAFFFSFDMPWFNLLKGRDQNIRSGRLTALEIRDLLGVLTSKDKWKDSLHTIGKYLKIEHAITDIIKVLEAENPNTHKNTLADYIQVSCDVVTDINNESYILKGYIDDFYFDSNGLLDRIILRGASKRRYRSRLPFTPILGDLFVLKYADLKSLNIQYENLLLNYAELIAGLLAADKAISLEDRPPE